MVCKAVAPEQPSQHDGGDSHRWQAKSSRRQGQLYKGGSSAERLWAAIVARFASGVRLQGNRQCGLEHTAVQAIFSEKAEQLNQLRPEQEAPLLPAGRRCDFFGLNPHGGHYRQVLADTGAELLRVLRSVSPEEPERLLAAIFARPSLRASLAPQQMFGGSLGWNSNRMDFLQTPFVKQFVQVYKELPTLQLKRRHLAMFAPFHPYATTQRLFGVSRHKVYVAKIQAAAYGGAAHPVPRRVASLRITRPASEALLQFLNDDENVQILAHSLSHGRESHGLKQVPEKLFVKYHAVTNSKLRVSRSTFLEYISSARCFDILRARTCLCGPCLEGTQAFTDLAGMIDELGTCIGNEDTKAFKDRAKALCGYLQYRYRGSCGLESPFATKCITYALSGPESWNSAKCSATCAGHTSICTKDSECRHLVNDLRDATNMCKANRPEGSRAPLHPNPVLRPLQPQPPPA